MSAKCTAVRHTTAVLCIRRGLEKRSASGYMRSGHADASNAIIFTVIATIPNMDSTARVCGPRRLGVTLRRADERRAGPREHHRVMYYFDLSLRIKPYLVVHGCTPSIFSSYLGSARPPRGPERRVAVGQVGSGEGPLGATPVSTPLSS